MDFHSTQNPILSVHKHVHLKATYPLRVHRFTAQQVGKGGKSRNEFLNTKSNLEYAQATYSLRVHKFTAHQVGKGVRRRNEFSLNTKSNLDYAQACSFQGNLPAETQVYSTASG